MIETANTIMDFMHTSAADIVNAARLIDTSKALLRFIDEPVADADGKLRYDLESFPLLKAAYDGCDRRLEERTQAQRHSLKRALHEDVKGIVSRVRAEALADKLFDGEPLPADGADTERQIEVLKTRLAALKEAFRAMTQIQANTDAADTVCAEAFESMPPPTAREVARRVAKKAKH